MGCKKIRHTYEYDEERQKNPSSDLRVVSKTPNWVTSNNRIAESINTYTLEPCKSIVIDRVLYFGYRYGFNGMEKDNQIKGQGNSYNYKTRMYDSRLGRWLSIDPQAYRGPSLSPYNMAFDSPMQYVDIDGNWSILIHYLITYRALRKAGVEKEISRTIAHYVSVYADGASGFVRNLNISMIYKNSNYQKSVEGELSNSGIASDMGKNPEINYSKTANSQDNKNAKWHQTITPEEFNAGMTAEDRKLETCSFAWDCLFVSMKSGDLGSHKMNTNAMHNLAQALHAWEDMYAHQGSIYPTVYFWEKGKGQNHSLLRDTDYPLATEIAMPGAEALLTVHQVYNGQTTLLDAALEGRGGTLRISLQGANEEQVNTIFSKFKDLEGYSVTLEDAAAGNKFLKIEKN